MPDENKKTVKQIMKSARNYKNCPMCPFFETGVYAPECKACEKEYGTFRTDKKNA